MNRPCGGHLTGWNVAARLDAVFGDEPRRIHGALVLADAGASVTEYSAATLRVAAAVAPDADVAAAHRVLPRVEPADTLLRWAEQPPALREHVGERTWLSTLERAVLEAVDVKDISGLSLEIAARALTWKLAGSSERIHAAADELGWDQALRKLRSLATIMHQLRYEYPVPIPNGMLHPEYEPLTQPPARTLTGGWAVIDDFDIDTDSFYGHDYDNRVTWVEEPEMILDNILH